METHVGVEYYLFREDNKTAFDLGKGSWYQIEDKVFDPTALLEHLVVWTINFEGANQSIYMSCCFVIE